MSTVMDSALPAIDSGNGLTTFLSSPVIREGDWQAYLTRTVDMYSETHELADLEILAEYKRQCAFDYLGKRAQKQGGVCSKKPRILSPDVVKRLEESNRAKRYARYPWIEKLLKLMAEIERLQEENAASQNVFSLVQPTRNP
ncbi:hypothetical protein [Oxalicibacterium solurbis]|uniref:Uncharacterized protein n=1 Tax=Oxalicibacterium solurbis TaxID=69280 RepID=A0A8J3AWK6_9BURK|nr:hypothetical protein [Oxalicibacterium solurbis]GGI54277.1 hypothetical protein GCM10011430_14510 [Oxalicibacterium solurbis]